MELTAPMLSFVSPQRRNANSHGWFHGGAAFLIDASGGARRRLTSDSSGSTAELYVLRPMVTSSLQAPGSAAGTGVLRALSDIQRVFGLNFSELAEVAHVTRRAVYDWHSGARPRQAALERLLQLRRAALDWQRAAFPAPGPSLHDPVLGGRSLWELLCAEPLDLDAIHFAGSRLQLRDEVTRGGTLLDPFG
jgi:hypothetical protein